LSPVDVRVGSDIFFSLYKRQSLLSFYIPPRLYAICRFSLRKIGSLTMFYAILSRSRSRFPSLSGVQFCEEYLFARWQTLLLPRGGKSSSLKVVFMPSSSS
ncbi:hypothetical protein Tsubulata_002919, partial [Turnera subulata]